mmetsp:Transcript_28411/g.58123  ORF Transcript_28411/g.58123 Transcript_28411/m.58123 type:complete len:258 (-) Transcript_28411:175-948(-)
MGKLHGIAITILQVVLNILAGVKVHAVLIKEDTNLDLLALRAVRSSKELVAIVVLVDVLAFKELSGINVAILLHVLNLFAGVNARAVIVLKLAATIFLCLLLLLAVLLACLAPILLLLLSVLHICLKVGLHVDNVFAVSVVAPSLRVGGAQTEDNKALGGKDSAGILVVRHLIIVGLDELALLKLHRVGGDVGHCVGILSVELTGLELGAGSGLGILGKLRDIPRLGVILSLLGSEGTGRGLDKEKGKSELGEHGFG